MAARRPDPTPEPRTPEQQAAQVPLTSPAEALHVEDALTDDETAQLAADESLEEQGNRLHAEAEAAIERRPLAQVVEGALTAYAAGDATLAETGIVILSAAEDEHQARLRAFLDALASVTVPEQEDVAATIAARPRRPRTLEDAKADTGYSTSGAEAERVLREQQRQPR